MLKQCKGKALDKVPASRLKSGQHKYIVMTKYDGNYVQIVKKDNDVKFYTSGGKAFYWVDVAKSLVKNFRGLDFVLEGEYVGLSEGKLGDRVHAAKLTTYRTNFKHAIPSQLGDERLYLFDVPYYCDPSRPNMPRNKASARYDILNQFKGIVRGLIVCEAERMTLDEAISYTKRLTNEGWEGTFIKHLDQLWIEGKRVNDSIKLKYRQTADLLCTGVTDGEGKYMGMRGALRLIDKEGITVSVGSGLSDMDRHRCVSDYLGKVIEIEYEQIIDTYIQPTFIRIRHDKTPGDID